jgi:hypothetical protein
MVASGPGTLPAAIPNNAGVKLNAPDPGETHPESHVNDRDETRALWDYLAGTGRLTSASVQAAVNTFTKVKLGSVHDVVLDTKITVPVGTIIEGDSDVATVVRWTGADDGVMFEREGPDPPDDPVFAHFTIRNMKFETVESNITAIRSYYGGFETFEGLSFYGIQTHFDIEGGFRPVIRNVYATTLGPNSCGGAVFKKMPHIDISGYTTYNPSTAEAVWTFHKVAAGTISNFNFYALETIGILIEEDCQGLVFTGGLIVAPTIGVVTRDVSQVSPSFCECIGVKIDQADEWACKIEWGAQIYFTRCEFTNSRRGAFIGKYNGAIFPDVPHAIRAGFFLCTFENIGADGINCEAGATYFNILGNHFLGMGASSVGAVPAISPPWDNSGVCLRIPAGTTEDILVAHNDMRNNAGGAIVDGSTGNRRCYWDNTGDEPSITNLAGTSVKTVAQLQADKWLIMKQQGGTPSAPPTDYLGLYFKTDGLLYKQGAVGSSSERRMLDTDIFTTTQRILQSTGAATFTETASPTVSGTLTATAGLSTSGTVSGATISGSTVTSTGAVNGATAVIGATAAGFGIVQRVKRRDAGSPVAALAFGVTSAAETDVVKGFIAMKRRGGQGTGDVLFGLDNNADTNDADESDVKAKLLGIPTAGAQSGAHWIFPYFDNSPPADADMMANTICFYADETGNTLKAKIKYKNGTTIKNITTPIPIA